MTYFFFMSRKISSIPRDTMRHGIITRGLRILATALIVAALTAIAYECHTKAFVAGFLYLLPIVFIAFGWGWLEASVASVLAAGCLDYFFTAPVFLFTMADSQGQHPALPLDRPGCPALST